MSLNFYKLSSTSTSSDDFEYLVKVDDKTEYNDGSLRAFSEALPVVEAETYHYGELPYHAPPEIYKVCYDGNNQSTIYQRKKVWDGEFLDFYEKTKSYPSLKYERMKNVKIQSLFQQDTFLDKNKIYLWVVDAKCRFIFCVEKQVDCSINRNFVKHGDMVATGQFIGTVNNIVSGRGPARLGGEFLFDHQRNQWCLNNDSSYCFFRTDKQIISNGRGFKWQNLIDNLFGAYDIDTSELLYIDMVQSRRLDGYLIQSTAFNFQRHRNKTKKNQALEHMFGESHGLLTLFKDVDFSDFLLSSFGADVYLLTEGVVQLQIIRGDNIPGNSLLSYPERFCKIYTKGCEYGVKKKWWHRPQRTESIRSKTSEPIHWNSKIFEIYVTVKFLEVIVIDIYQSPNQKIGSVCIDIDQLKEGIITTGWYPVNCGKSNAKLGVSLKFQNHISHDSRQNLKPNRIIPESGCRSRIQCFSSAVWFSIFQYLDSEQLSRMKLSRKLEELIRLYQQSY